MCLCCLRGDSSLILPTKTKVGVMIQDEVETRQACVPYLLGPKQAGIVSGKGLRPGASQRVGMQWYTMRTSEDGRIPGASSRCTRRPLWARLRAPRRALGVGGRGDGGQAMPISKVPGRCYAGTLACVLETPCRTLSAARRCGDACIYAGGKVLCTLARTPPLLLSPNFLRLTYILWQVVPPAYYDILTGHAPMAPAEPPLLYFHC